MKITQKHALGLILCTAITANSCFFGAAFYQSSRAEAAVPPYSDTTGHWSELIVKRLAAKGSISGNPDGSFRPESSITREEFATILVRALDRTAAAKELTNFRAPFTDVASGKWSSGYICEAYELGIINGYTNGSFSPKQRITRAEMAVMLASAGDYLGKQAATQKAKQFNDSYKIPTWAKSSVDAMTALAVVGGYPDGSFRPQRQTTRAEAAAFLSAFLDRYSLLFDFAGLAVGYDYVSKKLTIATEQGDIAIATEPDLRYTRPNGAALPIMLVEKNEALRGIIGTSNSAIYVESLTGE